MSTRSAIIMKVGEGFYEGIYCHNDGYPSGVGQALLDHYTDPETVRALLDLGAISVLGERVAPVGDHSFNNPEPGTTIAYHRDRGEALHGPIGGATAAQVAERINHAHVYIFEDGAWTCDGEPAVDGKF